MSKKQFAIASLIALSALGLTSCGPNEKPMFENLTDDMAKNVALNLDVMYAKSSRITNIKETFTDVSGKTYDNGALLPMWEQLQQDMNIKISDGSYYQESDDKEYASLITTNNGVGSNGKQVRLFMNTITNMTTMAKNDQLLPISDYLSLMPNFSAYLDANPSVKQQLTVDGKIYSTPYFDGADKIEKTFQMNTRWVELLLDGTTSPHNNTPTTYDGTASDTLGTPKYTPFYTTDINTTVKVVNAAGTAAVNFTYNIPASKNIIAQMNAASDKTGKNLVEMFRAYIDEIYGSQIGTGKIWSKRSELFTGASALYNADELVALMRCVQTNTQALTGQNTNKVVVFAPRGTADNRYINILHLASMWGVRGLTSAAETDQFYFDSEGNLQTAATDEASYVALDNLHKLYEESLIVQNPKGGYNGTTGGNVYRDNYLAKGLQFMAYDYTASVAEVDSSYEFKDTTANNLANFRAVVSPVAQWHANGASDNSFTRFSEDSRALKNGGWCILTNGITAEEAARSLTVMDYFFSDEGADLQDFGPNNIYYRAAVTQYDTNGKRISNAGTITLEDGSIVVKMSDAVKSAIGSAGSWTNFYRQKVGATFGIGHVRSQGLEYQINAPSAQVGLANIETAIKLGAMSICTSAAENPFYRSVPTVWDIETTTKDDVTTRNQDIIDLWKQTGGKYFNIILYGYNSTAEGQATLSLDAYKAKFDECNKTYLRSYRDVYKALSKN